VREHRSIGRRAAVRSTGPVATMASTALRLWAKVTRSPVDSMTILGAAAASLVIVVNAVFLQSDPHPAPFFANPVSPPSPAAENRLSVINPPLPKSAALVPAHPTPGERAVQSTSARHTDPIGDLIGTSAGSPSRIMAVQRLLAEFGYGQIKPTGTIDDSTSAAIQRFESEHKLPVTGRLSDRLFAELATMTGRPVE
jgi:Putative peptidoglycan binding domain